MHGLKDIHVKKIQSAFANCKAIDKAILYGSRAKGNYRNGSDIDLTLVGNALDLSMLLKIENTDLIEHINRVGFVFYEKAEI